LIVKHLEQLENCENLKFISGSLPAGLISNIGVATR